MSLAKAFDKRLNRGAHVADIPKESCFRTRLREILAHDMLTYVVHALITSRLDHCNFLVGISAKLITKLQRIQNIAARMISLDVGNMTTSLLC